MTCRVGVRREPTPPPDGYEWHPTQAFYTDRAVYHFDLAECRSCGFKRREHGPRKACLRPLPSTEPDDPTKPVVPF